MPNAPWADPRGAYAILVLLALALFGASLAPGGLRSRSRRASRLVAAAVLLGAAGSLLVPAARRRWALDTNAGEPAVTHLAGTWHDGGDTLVLDTNGSYSCRGPRCGGFGPRGTWRLEPRGGLVARGTDGRQGTWRIARYNSRYRLAPAPARESGATWEADLTFERAGP